MSKTIFKKNISFKPSRPGGGTFHLEIKLKEGNETREYRDWSSLEVVENPIILTMSADSRGGHGQCQDFIEQKIKNFKKNEQIIIEQILDIWHEYHLNDSNAGTKYQTELLSNFKHTSLENSYEERCIYLESKNALYDRNFKYGTGNLYREIPEDIIKFLKNL